jgi:polyhydroxyalkanoate synthase
MDDKASLAVQRRTAGATPLSGPAARTLRLQLPPEQAEPRTAWDELDRLLHAAQGRLTFGMSPLALPLASADYAAHLTNSPFHRWELLAQAWGTVPRFWRAVLFGELIEPAFGDRRFTDPQWNAFPFVIPQQAFLLAEAWMEEATCGPRGVNLDDSRLVAFAARQWLDVFSPSNFPWTNPEVIDATLETWGDNLVRGAKNFLDDLASLASFAYGSAPKRPDGLEVGRDLGVTPGDVIYRNRLIEIIQYSPQTDSVRPEPILIIPAWIMKYYILDLSPHDSLIRYLVRQGFTVFCISWKNPGPELREASFDDYRKEGVATALQVVGAIRPGVRIHACGYCLGGTLLAIAAADIARAGDERLATITLFAVETDFTEAGELRLFTTQDQVAFLEDVMAAQGYLEGKQMGGAFQLLRSRDLIWSRLVKTYLLGERDQPNDLMTWNEDATRLPHRMHSEYLRRLYLRNDLAEGRFEVEGRAISVGDIRAPFFVVSTETDHVAPWRSVHKIHLQNDGEITFVLTTGGHNAGIVSEPGHPNRRYRITTRAKGGPYIGPDDWLAVAEPQDGSWWPAWIEWLAARSGRPVPPPPGPGAPEKGYPSLGPAPGSFVFEQ